MTEQDEEQALARLRRALEREEECQKLGRWEPPESDQVPQRMCRACLIRWSCPSVRFALPWQSGAVDQQQEEKNYEF